QILRHPLQLGAAPLVGARRGAAGFEIVARKRELPALLLELVGLLLEPMLLRGERLAVGLDALDARRALLAGGPGLLLESLHALAQRTRLGIAARELRSQLLLGLRVGDERDVLAREFLEARCAPVPIPRRVRILRHADAPFVERAEVLLGGTVALVGG